MRLAPAQLAASWQRRRRRASPRCPFGRATLLCNTGAAAAGSAAHVVLEWGAPWSRETHKYYPPKVRARVAALMVVGQRLKHADRFLLDVWETYVVPRDIASEMWR